MIDTSKLVTKDYLKKFGDKSKRLFKANPVHTKMDGTYGNWILVETLIDYNLGFDELCLNIQGISFDEYIENKKLINSSFYVTTDSQSGAINYASGLNLGQDGIQAVVFVSASSSSAGEAPKLLIWLKLSDDRYIDETIIDIIACKEEEVLFQTITSVDYNSQPDEPVEYKQIASDSDHKPFSDPIIGTIISQLTEATQFTIVEDQVIVSDEPVPTEYKTYPETSVFNRIFSSKESDQLSHGLIFQYDWENSIGSEDNPVTITNGELISGQVVKIPIPDLFANGADSHDQWVNQVKVENGIVTDVQSGIPLAKSTQIGGMYLDGSPSSLTVNQYPVKLTAQGIGYVNIPASDVHRYANLNNVPSPKVGDIVQYIGSTTSTCTNGFFYQYWPEAFTASIPSNLYWNTIGTGSDMANAIAAYNESLSYLLRPNVGISITLKPVTLYQPGTQTELADGTTVAITDDTLFTVSQGDYSVDLSYADIKTHFTIELKPQYVSYTYYGSQSTQAHSDEPHWTVPVTFDEATFEQEPPLRRHWVQKNVQPVINMQSALVYKGTVQTMADLQALTPTAQTGDFYTVTQLSNQEYFFTGTDWEFMGDVFTVDGSLTIKSKDGSTETTVAEFTANQSGNTSVELVAGTNVSLTTDTTGDDKKITISSANTTYTGGTAITIDSNNAINHDDIVTAGTAQGSSTKTLTFGDTFDIPTVTYNAQGHITGKGVTTMTMPADPRNTSLQVLTDYSSISISNATNTYSHIKNTIGSNSAVSAVAVTINADPDTPIPYIVDKSLLIINNKSSAVTVSITESTSATTLIDFAGITSIPAGKSVEFIFTFMGSGLVTYNGGVSF